MQYNPIMYLIAIKSLYIFLPQKGPSTDPRHDTSFPTSHDLTLTQGEYKVWDHALQTALANSGVETASF